MGNDAGIPDNSVGVDFEPAVAKYGLHSLPVFFHGLGRYLGMYGCGGMYIRLVLSGRPKGFQLVGFCISYTLRTNNLNQTLLDAQPDRKTFDLYKDSSLPLDSGLPELCT